MRPEENRRRIYVHICIAHGQTTVQCKEGLGEGQEWGAGGQ